MTQGELAQVDDRELMARHVAGDADAFGELFRRHRDRMWGVALSVCRDPELAADAVQDGFVNAYRRAGAYRGEALVTTWLHRVVVNACLDRLRTLRPTDSVDELEQTRPGTLPALPDRTGEVETRMAVETALAALPEPQRLALVLVDMHAVPISEAAEMLGCAEGTIKSRCHRGRAALADLLGPTFAPHARTSAGTSPGSRTSDPRPPRADGGGGAR